MNVHKKRGILASKLMEKVLDKVTTDLMVERSSSIMNSSSHFTELMLDLASIQFRLYWISKEIDKRKYAIEMARQISHLCRLLALVHATGLMTPARKSRKRDATVLN